MFGENSLQLAGTDGNALPAAAVWIEGVLTGTVSTAIAAVAVAGIGFAMLTGRLSPRRGLRVVLGCFILFGASTIAHGLIDGGRVGDNVVVTGFAVPPPSQPAFIPDVPAMPQKTGANPFDPYAGVSTLN